MKDMLTDEQGMTLIVKTCNQIDQYLPIWRHHVAISYHQNNLKLTMYSARSHFLSRERGKKLRVHVEDDSRSVLDGVGV